MDSHMVVKIVPFMKVLPARSILALLYFYCASSLWILEFVNNVVRGIRNNFILRIVSMVVVFSFYNLNQCSLRYQLFNPIIFNFTLHHLLFYHLYFLTLMIIPDSITLFLLYLTVIFVRSLHLVL